MNTRFYAPLYALTLLISAALLFSVQPMFSKMILPLLGGTPQVWNMAMLFFQIALLLGYAYAHFTSRFLGVKAQSILHLVLMIVFAFALPLGIPENWPAPHEGNPALWQLSLMFVTVGGPFFILAACAPTLQRWFSYSAHKDADNPYFLYSASNLGSLSALLAYPVIIEPLLSLDDQSLNWAFGYGGLFILIALSALSVWRKAAQTNVMASESSMSDTPSWGIRLRWLVLAFIPSSLMLGVTTYITTDIASVPLLWILPLALYVGTFVFVFARKQIISDAVIMWGFLAFLSMFIVQMVWFLHIPVPPFAIVFIHLGLFFFTALMCHQDLANARPKVSHLTEFYLTMSLGGAIGGFFNAIIAPQFFIIPLEYPLILTLACFMRYSMVKEKRFTVAIEKTKSDIAARGFDGLLTFNNTCLVVIAVICAFAFASLSPVIASAASFTLILCLFLIHDKRWSFGIGFMIIVLLFPPGFHWGYHSFTDIMHRDRNFFGVMKVVNSKSGERQLIHGTTNHGSQALDEAYRLEPLSYYSENSPLRSTFSILDKRSGAQEVAIVGLGIGVTACFQKDGRHFDFYEIDPAIAEVASNPDLFTFLSDCNSPYDIIIGDGRLTLQEKPNKHYDLIVLDAFSSDNVPMHLLTLEAAQGYLSKLKDDGMLVFNVSNNYVDLEPALTLIAKELNLHGYGQFKFGETIEGTDLNSYPAHFFMMTRSDDVVRDIVSDGWSEGQTRQGVKLWSDQYSNIISVLGNRTVIRRLQAAQTLKNQIDEGAESTP